MELLIPVSSFEAPPAPFFEISYMPVPASRASKSSHKLAKLFAIVGVIILLVAWGPSLFFKLTNEANRYKISASSLPITSSNYQPVFDKSLPLENSIQIKGIKVNGAIHEASNEDHEEALSKGFWRVTDYGTPFDRTLPTIIVAHRFGYVSWSNMFRRENSFYNLPKLQMGDTVEIVWRQRKYTYAVYAESKGTEITDYQADLILYTCEDLSSDVKIIKYAKLIEL